MKSELEGSMKTTHLTWKVSGGEIVEEDLHQAPEKRYRSRGTGRGWGEDKELSLYILCISKWREVFISMILLGGGGGILTVIKYT